MKIMKSLLLFVSIILSIAFSFSSCMKGEQGEPGLSAFEIYLKYHPDYKGSEEDWINGLTGSGKAPETGIFTFAKNADGVSYTLVSYLGHDKGIDIPSTYAGFPVTTIASGAFGGNDSIEAIRLPDSITTIESYSFEECMNLRSISLSNSVKTIGDNATERCPNIEHIYFDGSKEEWEYLVRNNEIFVDPNRTTVHYGAWND